MRLNSVKVDEQHFYISNFRRTEKLPVSNLIDVSTIGFINVTRIWITFKTNKSWNQSYLFMPDFSFSGIFSTHPTAKELMEVAKNNNAKSG